MFSLFPFFKPPKIQTICSLSVFQKITMFLAKIWFYRITLLFTKQLILSFFCENLYCEKSEIVHLQNFILQSFSYFSLSIFLYHKTPCFQETILRNFQKFHDSRKFIQLNILHYSIRKSLSQKNRFFLSLIKAT